MKTPPIPLAQLTDYSTITVVDGLTVFDLTNRVIRGPQVVLEQCARAVVTPPGSLIWARNDGVDFFLLENVTLSPGEEFAWQKLMVEAVQRVDYVRAARISVAFGQRTFSAVGSITLVDGLSYPFAVTAAFASAARLAAATRAA